MTLRSGFVNNSLQDEPGPLTWVVMILQAVIFTNVNQSFLHVEMILCLFKAVSISGT